FAKFEPLQPHHEVENVSPNVAHPALKRLPVGIDLQARPRVVVPGAVGHVNPSLPAQRKIATSEIDYVDRLANLLLGIVRSTKIHSSTPLGRQSCCHQT